MNIRALAALGAALILACGIARAQPAAGGDDVVRTISGVETVCAGSTTDSRQRWVTSPYSTRLEFVGKDGQFLGQEQLSITGARGLSLQIACNGPWVLMNLPAGAYHVSADVRDVAQKDFELTVGSGGPRVTIVRFTNSGGQICVPQPNDDCKSDQSGTTANLNSRALAPDPSDPEFVRMTQAIQQLTAALTAQQAQYNGAVTAYNGMLDQSGASARQLAALKTQCDGDLKNQFANLQKEQSEQKRWNEKQRQKYQDDLFAYNQRQQTCNQQIAAQEMAQAQSQAQLTQLTNQLAEGGRQIASLNQQLTQANVALTNYRNDVNRRVGR